jgi:hypothetical protein
MTGRIEDRWTRPVPGPGGRTRRQPTPAYGTGMRYRAYFTAPDGTRYTRAFPHKQRTAARAWLTAMATTTATPGTTKAFRIIFRQP